MEIFSSIVALLISIDCDYNLRVLSEHFELFTHKDKAIFHIIVGNFLGKTHIIVNKLIITETSFLLGVNFFENSHHCSFWQL